MNRPRLIALLAVGVLAAGCTQTSPARGELPSLTSTAASAAVAAIATAPELADLPGRLVILGPRDEIVVMRPDGSEPMELVGPSDEIRRRTVPTWSPDGTRIAWTDELADLTGTLIVAGIDGEELVRMPVPMVAEYIDWAPDGSRLAFMGNDDFGEFRLAVVEISAETFTELGTGAPMSIDWHPDGETLVVRVEERVELVSADGRRRMPVETSGPLRLAAFVGEELIIGRIADVGQFLTVVEADGGRSTAVLRYGGPTAYVVHPDGDRLAVMGQSSLGALAVSEFAAGGGDDSGVPALGADQLTILDLETGETMVIAETRAVSWSWSPDGETLMWTDAPVVDGIQRIRWHATAGGTTSDFAAVSPGGAFARSYLAFFDQFERGLTLWSPDSAAFAYAGGEPGTSSGIWVQRLGAVEPLQIAAGQTVSWSPR